MNTTDITIEQFNDLVQWVESARKETGRTYHLYAIVDGVLDESLLSQVQQKNVPWRGLYPDTMLEANNPATGPFLVALLPDNAGHAELIQALLRRGQGADLLLWAVSAQPLPLLAAHLHCYAEVTLPDRSAALLRYYDPSILEVLVRMFTPQQLDHFLAPIREYRYWREGWQTIAGKDEEQPKAALEQYIALTGEQYEQLSNESFAETLFHQIRSELLAPIAQADDHQCIQYIRKLLARAVDSYKLKKQNDLAFFSLIGLNVNFEFDAHPDIAKVLLSSSNDEESLSSRLSNIDATVWDQLLRDGHAMKA
jgi:hypothetical protein